MLRNKKGKKITDIKKITHEEWLNIRQHSIGGSECAIILGLNKYKSAYTLWAEKLGLIPGQQEDTEVMRQGRDFEDYVAQRFSEITNKKIRKNNYMYRHSDYPFITANIDREIVGENAGLECKTTSIYNKCDFENGEIPPQYYCQCMHYMAVMGYEKMYLAVLVLSKGFYWFEINRNECEINALINQEVEFWNTFILGSEIPIIDDSDNTYNTIKQLKINNKENILNNDENKNLNDIEHILTEYNSISEQIKYLEKKLKQCKNIILASLDNYSNGYSNKFIITNKIQESKRFDSTQFKNDNPDLYNQYSKTSTSNILKIKEIKGN